MHRALLGKFFLCCLVFCSSILGSAWAAAFAPYSSGHMDMTMRFAGGTLIAYWKNDGDAIINGSPNFQPEFSAGEIRAFGLFDGSTSQQTPAIRTNPSAAWDAIGVGVGEPFYLFPSSASAGIPYIGYSTEDPSLADFDDDFRFTLIHVAGPMGATVTINLGINQILASGVVGGPPPTGFLELENQDHLHFFHTFSHVGIYDLTFELSGTRFGDLIVGQQTFRFEIATQVIPEPSAGWLLCLALAMLFIRRKSTARNSGI
jgi:hypothetical protein